MPDVRGVDPGYNGKYREYNHPHWVEEKQTTQQESVDAISPSNKMPIAGSSNYVLLEPRFDDNGEPIFGGKSNPQENQALTDFFGKGKLTIHFLDRKSSVNYFDPTSQKLDDFSSFITKSITYKEGFAHDAFRDSRRLLEDEAKEDYSAENQNENGVTFVTPKDCLVCNEDGSMRGVLRCDMNNSSTNYYLIANPEICKFQDAQSSDNSPEA